MAGTKRLHALVIDDEPAIRALLFDLLTTLMGAERVDIADNGATGLALFDQNRYDLVVTDFMMPGLRGSEVAEAVLRRDSQVKVVMLTGSATHEDVRRARLRGITVLTKPLTLHEIKDALERVLRGKDAGPARGH